jgi:hypothetical protein
MDSEGLAIIWDVKTWRPVCRVEGLPLLATYAALSPDGKYFIVRNRDEGNSAPLYELPTTKAPTGPSSEPAPKK